MVCTSITKMSTYRSFKKKVVFETKSQIRILKLPLEYVTRCRSEQFLYHVEYDVELGVCVCLCVSRFERGWAHPSEVKKEKKGKKSFYFSWDVRSLGEKPWLPLSLVLSSCPREIKQVDFLVTTNFRFSVW